MKSLGILAAIENESRDERGSSCTAYVDCYEDGVEKRRFTCTRGYDHDGNHVAGGSGGNDGPYAVWY